MLRISKLADYSIRIMTLLAKSEKALLSAHEIAVRIHLNAPTVSKLLKQLQESALVKSQRGATGGYVLAQLPAEISLSKIIAAIDGPIATTPCSLPNVQCEHAAHCDTKENWMVVNEVIESALSNVSLHAMCYSLRDHPLKKIGSESHG